MVNSIDYSFCLIQTKFQKILIKLKFLFIIFLKKISPPYVKYVAHAEPVQYFPVGH